ncbi:MAG: hypothetical protein GXN96_00070 [Aquificae bacterium]|nr:hypothetical protein [Aquificota bacterium]
MKRLRDKLRAYEVLGEVFNVIAVLSLNRFRKARGEVLPKTPYFRRLEEVLEHLFFLNPYHPLFKPRERGKRVLVVFGSELSFTRSLCSRLLKEARQREKEELYIIGSRCFPREYSEKAEKREGVFRRNLNPYPLISLAKDLFLGYREGRIREVFVLYAEPVGGKGERGELRRREVKEEKRPHERFYEKPAPRPVRAAEVGLGASYRPRVVRFLPPTLRRRYRKGEILNYEVEEEQIISMLLELYLQFYTEFLALEHFTSLNLVRFQTCRRIQENISRRIKEVQRELSKERQERINRELQDIVLAMLSFQGKPFPSPALRLGAVLEMGRNLHPLLKERIVEVVSRLFPVAEVREVEDLLAFRIIAGGEVYEASPELQLENFLSTLKENLS